MEGSSQRMIMVRVMAPTLFLNFITSFAKTVPNLKGLISPIPVMGKMRKMVRQEGRPLWFANFHLFFADTDFQTSFKLHSINFSTWCPSTINST